MKVEIRKNDLKEFGMDSIGEIPVSAGKIITNTS